ncbi:sugar phosphate isomerase/epimerase family protein [Cnuibacter sp. UC19_7]|uniref:sugar phosphate isomerase/epimerase family protein n=1 Tax=Cnuibacter sp. UC19_7 TaxID=3350166 RepID=UPI00366F995B
MNDTAPSPDLVLWDASVRDRPLQDRLAVARAAGFTQQSVFPSHITDWLQQGRTLTDIAREARTAGVPITILDPFTRWLPGWQLPAWMNEDERAFQITDETTFFDYAAGLQVDSMSVIDGIGQRNDLDDVVSAFQRMCDRAAELDMRVQLEFMPFGSIPDLATGWEIVRRADRDNGGLVLDTYHFFRGYPDLDLLRRVPGDRIFAVQLSDAAAEVQDGSLYNDQMHHREAPGRGALPLRDLIDVLRETGGLHLVGPELFSDSADALSDDALAEVLATSTAELLG